MNCDKIKAYAPKARRDFIKAVTDRAVYYGLTESKVEPITEQGDVAIIGGKPFPRNVAEKRNRLESRISLEGYEQTMEAIAYTWFNRFVAIRYMEINGYLDHGYRVLSHPQGNSTPEILGHAADVDLLDLDRSKAVELKLDGTQDEELYRLLLKVQCNALHQAMPFLFEKIGDETELLLPTNLLHTDSLIRQMVEQVDEELWRDIEIIGWLYQFYISEKKDEVIGKVVKSEDIPAATQLFTPNWIVKYMVQNSLGAQWLATYPESKLKGQMGYYIEPAEQTDEVRAQLKAITPSTLNPEEITLIDPACGSGHILVEAYALFKAIYLERGYQQRDVAQLILEKNLFGLDIDVRAAQLTSFALMMKGRLDDRRLFERGVKLNVMSLVDSYGFDAQGLAKSVKLFDYGLDLGNLKDLKRLFKHSTSIGSLIEVPEKLATKLQELKELSGQNDQDIFIDVALNHMKPLVRQAEILFTQYDVVVANPPYCGSRYMNRELASFGKTRYPDSKADMFSMFIERITSLVANRGYIGVVCPFVWMFISTYELFRRTLLRNGSFNSMVRLEYNAFEPACVPVCTWIYQPGSTFNSSTTFIDLSNFKGAENQAPRTLEAILTPTVEYRYSASCSEFLQVPTAAFAYAVSSTFRKTFTVESKLVDFVEFTGSQNKTGKNSAYVRRWWEVDLTKIGKEKRWLPYAKGGGRRKWWGLLYDVVDWSSEAREFYCTNKTSNLLAERYWFRPGVTYSMLTSNQSTFRVLPEGAVYDMGGPAFHPHDDDDTFFLLSLCNSEYGNRVFKTLNPTLNLQVQDVKNLPIPSCDRNRLINLTKQCVELARKDWDSSEISIDFEAGYFCGGMKTLFDRWQSIYNVYLSRCSKLKKLESELNLLIIQALGLTGEVRTDITDDEVTLRDSSKDEDARSIVSYAIGCMMGRYSLDEPGFIYSHSGNEGFDPKRYNTFPADDDGIIPLTDTEWFEDDAANRLIKFISLAWDEAHLEANLTFLANNLSPRKNEPSRNTIRRYLNDSFFKDHLQTFKKRPIYWLFTSGKQKAFQCIVYLHRYNESTLSRMRTEYFIQLQGKISARIKQLKKDISSASSTSYRKACEKEHDKLIKQQAELQSYDEMLRHYADKRIKLDLDDGVKVNYGKFGDLLAEVKTVHGKKTVCV